MSTDMTPRSAGRRAEAARLWRVKVERSVRYLVAQLPDGHFAPILWLALAGNTRPSARQVTCPSGHLALVPPKRRAPLSGPRRGP
ncbi:hypothetical protein NGM37_21145 [Streptomyces sp. TRM76130]|nr:hypothetical protein [Streptomyces sp. TRM76130]